MSNVPRPRLLFRLLSEAAMMEPRSGWPQLVRRAVQLGGSYEVTQAEIEAVGAGLIRDVLAAQGVTTVTSRDQAERAGWLARFDDITDALAQKCTDPVVNDGYRLIFAQQERIRELAGLAGSRAGLRDAIRALRAVQAGWAFSVPEDGREQWLDEVTAAAAAPRVWVLVGSGGSGDNGLLDQAGLQIEAVLASPDEADRYASMGDIEAYDLPVGWPDDDEVTR